MVETEARKKTMKYKIYSRIDESGATVDHPIGFERGESDSLYTAIKIADGMPGAVIHRDDNAIMAPDGTWIGNTGKST
jgi:hypothetical protein